MTRPFRAWVGLLLGVAVAGIVLAGAGAATSQASKNSDDQEPWNRPSVAPPPRPHATSSLGATDPTPQDERQSRALAAAVFSRPAAAQRAADKASAANAAKLAPADPKPEWLADPPGVRFGGEGLQLSKPF